MADAQFKSHPAAELFPMLEGDEMLALRKDIAEHGLRVPIVLCDGRILDGRNRYQACRLVGVEPRFVEWDGDGDPAEWVLSVNLHRRHLNESQRALVGARLLDYHQARAKERQESTRAKPGERADERSAVENLPPRDTGKARDKAGEAVKVSGKSVEAAAKVLKQAAPEVVKAVEAGRVAVSDAARLLKQNAEAQRAALRAVEEGAAKTLAEASKILEKAANVEAIRAEPRPLPKGPYRVIAIDPPWRYDVRSDDASHRGRNPYADMSVEEICALPIGEMAHEDCILWLWTTNAFMRDAYQCLDAWGFKAKTILTWDKQKLGLGDWLRNVTEHCIVAVRGRPTVQLKSQTTLISEPRREHSRKPEAFYQLVEGLCPGSKVEVFSRTPRDGWETWGAEAEKFSESA